MMPQRAYVLFPTQIVRTLRGMRKYSTERAKANELGGTIQTSPLNSTKDFGSNCFGSTTADRALEDLELGRDPHVVAVGRHAVGDHAGPRRVVGKGRSEEHTSELQS